MRGWYPSQMYIVPGTYFFLIRCLHIARWQTITLIIFMKIGRYWKYTLKFDHLYQQFKYVLRPTVNWHLWVQFCSFSKSWWKKNLPGKRKLKVIICQNNTQAQVRNANKKKVVITIQMRYVRYVRSKTLKPIKFCHIECHVKWKDMISN